MKSAKTDVAEPQWPFAAPNLLRPAERGASSRLGAIVGQSAAGRGAPKIIVSVGGRRLIGEIGASSRALLPGSIAGSLYAIGLACKAFGPNVRSLLSALPRWCGITDDDGERTVAYGHALLGVATTAVETLCAHAFQGIAGRTPGLAPAVLRSRIGAVNLDREHAVAMDGGSAWLPARPGNPG